MGTGEEAWLLGGPADGLRPFRWTYPPGCVEKNQATYPGRVTWRVFSPVMWLYFLLLPTVLYRWAFSFESILERLSALSVLSTDRVSFLLVLTVPRPSSLRLLLLGRGTVTHLPPIPAFWQILDVHLESIRFIASWFLSLELSLGGTQNCLANHCFCWANSDGPQALLSEQEYRYIGCAANSRLIRHS